jgi:hypothetical protein
MFAGFFFGKPMERPLHSSSSQIHFFGDSRPRKASLAESDGQNKNPGYNQTFSQTCVRCPFLGQDPSRYKARFLCWYRIRFRLDWVPPQQSHSPNTEA